jgi:hypothetical protein
MSRWESARVVWAVIGVTLAAVPAHPQGARVRGIVTDALVAQQPLGAAEVALEGPVARTVMSGADGAFAFDALPHGTYRLTFYHTALERHGLSGAVLTVRVPDDSVVTLTTPSLNDLWRAACGASADASTGLVAGVVTGADDAPVAGATVRAVWRTWSVTSNGLAGAPHSVVAVTDASGRYRLCGVPRDGQLTWRAEVRGGETAIADIRLDGAAFAVQSVSLTGRAPQFVGNSVGVARLATTTVVASAAPDVTGFDTRRKSALGGRFITATEIEKRRAISTTDVFRGYPGVNVIPDPRSGGASSKIVFGRSIGSRGAEGMLCEPVVFVDGVRVMVDAGQAFAPQRGLPALVSGMPVNVLDQLTTPGEIQGIEMYSSVASAPPQYASKGAECGVILVWTKRQRQP